VTPRERKKDWTVKRSQGGQVALSWNSIPAIRV